MRMRSKTGRIKRHLLHDLSLDKSDQQVAVFHYIWEK